MSAKVCIWLSPEDRAELEGWVADRNTPQKLVWRSRIVLLSAAGNGTMSIMRAVGKSKPSVWRWQERYLAQGIAGLKRDATPSWTQACADAGSDCQGRGEDVARKACGSHALEHSDDGPGRRPQPHQCEADLACARAEAPSHARVQVVERQAVCRGGSGCRRPLPLPAGQSPGAERGREEPGPGPRPYPTRTADEKGPSGHHDARLQAPRHHFPVCRARCRHWRGDRAMHEAPPPSGVPALLADHRPADAEETRSPPRPRQLRHPQAF